jgi:hypothetical protein
VEKSQSPLGHDHGNLVIAVESRLAGCLFIQQGCIVYAGRRHGFGCTYFLAFRGTFTGHGRCSHSWTSTLLTYWCRFRLER